MRFVTFKLNGHHIFLNGFWSGHNLECYVTYIWYELHQYETCLVKLDSVIHQVENVENALGPFGGADADNSIMRVLASFNLV